MSDELMPVVLPTQLPKPDEFDEREGKPSASGLQRLMLCPGSWRAERGLPDVESADSAQGTRLHKHLEYGTLPDDAEEAEAVRWCRETEVALVEKYVRGDIDWDALHGYEFREMRWWNEEATFSGKPDYVFSDPSGTMLVVDYKFGRGEVPAARKNLQLAALAVLAHDNAIGVTDVYAAVLQPFVSRSMPEVVHYTTEDLKAARAYIAKLIDAAEREDAPMRAGEAQCKYCKAFDSCPAARLQVSTVSGLSLERWTMLTPEQRRQAYDMAQFAKRWAAKVEAAVKADLSADVEIPGLELSKGASTFEVTDAQAAFALLSEAVGLTAEEFTGCCKVKITELDRLVHAKLKAADESQKVMQSREYVRDLLKDVAKVTTKAGSVQEARPQKAQKTQKGGEA